MPPVSWQALLVMDGYYLGDGAGAGDEHTAPCHCAAAAAKLASMSAEVVYTADSTTWRLKHRLTLTGALAAQAWQLTGAIMRGRSLRKAQYLINLAWSQPHTQPHTDRGLW